MPDIFKSDFKDFLIALNTSSTEYVVVGGYAVIIHGYYRTTQDLDIWVNKTAENYNKLRIAYAIFGMPVFDMTLDNFMGDEFDVFSIGRVPLRIDIITKLKGLEFEKACSNALSKDIEGITVKYLHKDDLAVAKRAAGRFKDLDDLEKLFG
jgi:hypothetical protein